MILAVDNKLVSTFRELEQAVQKLGVGLTVWRNSELLLLDIDTAVLDGVGISHIFSWAGTLLQNPHRAMAAQRAIDQTGVYIAFFNYGSPASRYGLWAGRRIVAVDGKEIPDLQTFIDVVSGKDDQSSVRIKTVTWNGAVEIVTLKLDNQYWPSYEIRRIDGEWIRTSIG